MSEVNTEASTSGDATVATSGANTEASGSVRENQQQTQQTSSSSDHVQKLRKELDNWRTKAKELETKQAELEGNKDKVIEMLRAELGTMKKEQAEMLRSKVKDQVAYKAAELGCLNPDLMLKAIDVDQFEVDRTTLKIVDQDSLSRTLEEFRKNNPFMFKQTGPAVKDGVPANRVEKTQSQAEWKKLSTKELIEAVRKQEMGR
jgi:hypothetical protein